MISKKCEEILEYFNEILPNAKCELNYSKDYELVIAVMLSAQTTDKRVNEVDKELFSKYDSL
jgi:endonuclease-3